MSWKPLKHGDRFTYVIGIGVGRYRYRASGTKMPGEKAIRENWIYAEPLCTPETEGLIWARGWNSQAAAALRVADAL